MAVVFALMLLAFLFGWSGRRNIAYSCLFVCLIGAIGLFLWEVWSPDYGFRMPWLSAMIDQMLSAPAARRA